MDVRIAMVADAANVSQEGKLNVLGAFDTCFMTVLPGRFRQSDLVLRLGFNPVEKGTPRRIRIVLVDEDGKEGPALEASLEIPRDTPPNVNAVNLIVPLPILQFERYGDYQLAILIDSDHKADVPLRVVPPIIPAEAQQSD